MEELQQSHLLALEQEQARKQMLNYGLSFDVPKLSLLRFLPGGYRDKLGIKSRKLTIYKPYLYTMDVASELKLQIEINLSNLEKNPIKFSNKVIKDNAKLMARIMAVYLLNRSWKIKYFSGIVARYLMTHIDAEKLNTICQLVFEMENAANFIDSTVLMSGADRTLKPKAEPIEKNPTEPKVKQ